VVYPWPWQSLQPQLHGDCLRRPAEYPVTADLKKDFGAVGDGVADDTSALINAVAGVKMAAVIFIPEGGDSGQAAAHSAGSGRQSGGHCMRCVGPRTSRMLVPSRGVGAQTPHAWLLSCCSRTALHMPRPACPAAHARSLVPACRVPAGTYRITRPISMRSNVVLRGAGRDKAKLLFPLGLKDVPFSLGDR